MPIRPENLKRYPADWPRIRARILKRAGNCCEGSPAFPDCRAPNGSYRVKSSGEFIGLRHFMMSSFDDDEVTRIVLTIGHLDHMPEHCDESNLRAWCQRCHLAYDLEHHMQTARENRRKGRAARDMFEG